jgi:hypothetical protein
LTDIQNPYAPPTAVVVEPVTASSTHFSVGTMKLSLMAIATFGFYGIYW